MLASFLANLSMSAEGAKEMGKAAAELSIFGPGSSKNSKPTTDHLPKEDGSQPSSPPPSQQVNGTEPKNGSYERLGALFSGGLLGRKP
jgi:hypothetical protein